MEREIKFRGKCYGVWRYGSYVHFSKKPIHNVCDNSYKDFIVANENDGEHYYPITELSSTGEYTGLKDANGKEIYEGDIVSILSWKGVVVYNNEYASFNVRCGRSNIDIKNLFVYGGKVIGNIHDNPELMKGGSNEA